MDQPKLRIQILILWHFECVGSEIGLAYAFEAKEGFHTSSESRLTYLYELTSLLDEFKNDTPKNLPNEL